MSKLLAQQIHAAWTTRAEIATPSAGEFDMAAAYSTEAELCRMRQAEGHVAVGRKVGFANKAMWRILKLETLVWAHMYDDTVHFGREFSLAACRTPRIEPEIVFKLARPLSAGMDAAAVLASTEWIALGFEIIDCPYPDWQFQPTDFVAAYGLHRGLLIGSPLRIESAAVPELVTGLAQCKIRLLKNDALVEEGAGKNSLRSPALCVAELAAVTALGAGELISTGTLTAAQPISPGESWRAEVVGLPLAPVVGHFSL